MKAILEFDLNDPDDRIDHLRAVHADDLAYIIWDFVYNSKKEIEWKIDNDKLESYDVLDKVYERMSELLDEYGIDIDKFVV